MTPHKLHLGGGERLQHDLSLPKCRLIYNSNFTRVNRPPSSAVNWKLKDSCGNNENILLVMSVIAGRWSFMWGSILLCKKKIIVSKAPTRVADSALVL